MAARPLIRGSAIFGVRQSRGLRDDRASGLAALLAAAARFAVLAVVRVSLSDAASDVLQRLRSKTPKLTQ